MTSRAGAAPYVYLKAGEIFMSSGPACVTTVLGSCVAVTMFNERRGIWAICHALLPREDGRRNGDGDDFKYVDSSIGRMLKKFEKFMVGRGEIDAKLFGGADMFGAGRAPELSTVGAQNVKAALETLEKEGLAVSACDVGGRSGRKLYYLIPGNKVFVKRLDRLGPCPSGRGNKKQRG